MVAFVLAGCGGDSGGSHRNDQAATFRVTYDGNGEDTGSVPSDDIAYEEGESVTVLGNTGNLNRHGYAYSGWNTQADGSGTTYTQGQTFTMEAADVILYARWTTNPTYTVTYDGNGADSGSAPVDSTNYEQGQSVTVLDNTGNLARDGFLFTGWNTQPGGGGTSYTPGRTFAMGAADVILYAQWAVPGEAGALDPTFGGGTGFVTTSIDGMAYAMAIQNDGKILVAGDDATVVRYNSDGTLDDSFGTGGIVTLPAGFVSVRDMAIEPGDSDDFKIVLAGIGTYLSQYRMSAARLYANGSLDTTFSGDGIFHSSFSSNGSYGAQGVAIQADRKIVLVGETNDMFAVLRLTETGSPDASNFGNPNGWVTTAIQYRSHATAVAIQADGKIVVAGQSYPADYSSFDTTIVRYNTDGTLDSDEWNAGTGYVLNPYISEPTALAIQNGRILVSGGHLVGSHDEFAMIAFASNGWTDPTFGDGGFVTTPVGDGATAYAMALGVNEILLAGHATVGGQARLAVARYSADGDLDPIFGSPDGYVLTELGTSPYPYALALDALGRIVVAGGQGTGTSAFFVVRYMP